MATTSMKKLSIKPDDEAAAKVALEVSHPVAQEIMSRDYLGGDNPFRVPTDQDIFVLRDRERQRKKKEREADLKLPVWDKHTYRTRVERNAAQTRKEILAMDEEEGEGQAAGEDKDDTMWTLNVTSSDRKVDREDLTEYVNKKREMFLVQYSLRVKKDEMKKLEDLAVAEEQKLEAAEIYLEEDATMFDEFLKENDRNSVEAIKIAEAETKAKLEKVQEIKRCNAALMSIRSDISKHEEVLKEYILYKNFLEKLTPQEWKDVHLKKKSKKRKEVVQKRKKTPQTPHSQHRHTPTSVASSAASHHPRSKRGTTANSTASKRSNLRHATSRQRSVRSRVTHRDEVASLASTADRNMYDDADDDPDDLTSDDDPDEEVKLYFTDPEQLLAIFQELEEDNLSLITNSQETEEAMEELKQNLKTTEKKMSKQTEQLVTQIEVMEKTIAREEERADVLEMKCKMFNFGEFQAKDEDEALAFLNAKVEQVYQSCIGDNEANLSSLQMLTSVENRLEELFDQIDRMPPHLVESAEKAKEKERRMRMREEKILQQKLHQEERVRKALERAKADPKRKVGKRLVFRSEPPQRKQKDDKKKDSDIQKEEEDMYFFT